MVVLNYMDRYQLALDAIRRPPIRSSLVISSNPYDALDARVREGLINRFRMAEIVLSTAKTT